MALGSRFIGLVALLIISGGACETPESTNPVPVDPAHLDPPPQGQGFQFATQDITVAPGTEVQDCFFFQVKDLAKAGGLPTTEAVNLHRIQVAQRAGSHHMNIFRVKTVVNLGPAGGTIQTGLNGQGECFKSSNWADWPLVANSQQDGNVDWTYPDGVANTFAPDDWLMLQTHYVNATTQSTPEAVGHVTVNFWTIPKAEVKAELGTLFATTQSIRVCESSPKPTTFSHACQINSPSPVHVIGANGHFHSRGREFDIFSWDGKSETVPDSARFYQSLAWDDPPMTHSPDLDITLPPAGGVFYTCSYDWEPPSVGCDALNTFDQTKYMTPTDQLDCCYTFGPIVEKNEHCNAFVYYYPKTDDVNCF